MKCRPHQCNYSKPRLPNLLSPIACSIGCAFDSSRALFVMAFRTRTRSTEYAIRTHDRGGFSEGFVRGRAGLGQGLHTGFTSSETQTGNANSLSRAVWATWGPLACRIPFQFNPVSLRRKLNPSVRRIVAFDSAKRDGQRSAGSPPSLPCINMAALATFFACLAFFHSSEFALAWIYQREDLSFSCKLCTHPWPQLSGALSWLLPRSLLHSSISFIDSFRLPCAWRLQPSSSAKSIW